MSVTLNIDAALGRPVRHLLSAVGFEDGIALQPLDGGQNNRVYRVSDVAHGPDQRRACAVLKLYYHDADDTRDRMGAEIAFTRFAAQHGIDVVAKPLAIDHEQHVAIYDFIDGRKVAAHEIDKNLIGQCLDFLSALQHARQHAEHINQGSEACMSMADHMATVERRVSRLEHEATDAIVGKFVAEALRPRWDTIQSTLKTSSSMIRPCLSPSDFGFHNALQTKDGRLRFIDFEYAGWDDPAKLVNDFFCQPKIAVPNTYREMFIDRVAKMHTDDAKEREQLRQRIAILEPVYVIKWCCIVLNAFVPTFATRRRFAESSQQPAPTITDGLLNTARELCRSLDP